jgi:ATP-dependent helicase YprA (DUF1998 family)/ribosomal protein L40E
MTTNFDPLSTSDSIVADYQRYLRSLLPVGDHALGKSLGRAIGNQSALFRGPLIEATPAYIRGSTIQDLIDEDILPKTFARLDSDALPLDRQLYTHQEKATRKARAGRNLVVSTGTGSGKTESFLIPILSSLIEESEIAPLKPGVRALLLYPMNALANDQIKRLRRLLAKTPDITFGRYVGSTPQAQDVAERTYADQNPNEPLLPNELISREAMQATPPHLLLTNYAMLEYLLLRPRDMDLFEGAYGGSWRFLVVDEAHVYDGSRGSELAMLIRRLTDRVGAGALQCIATSATVGAETNQKAVTDFAGNLFGQRLDWNPNNYAEQDLIVSERLKPQTGTWGPIDPSQVAPLTDSESVEADILSIARSQGSVAKSAYEALLQEKTLCEIRLRLNSGAKTFEGIRQHIGTHWSDQDLRKYMAIGALLKDETGVPLLSTRYHLWARATEGAFTCLAPGDPHVSLNRIETCDECKRPSFEFGCCTRCGTTYIVGQESPDKTGSNFLPRISSRETPTWIALTESTSGDDEDEHAWEEEPVDERNSVEICAACGNFNPENAERCTSCSSNELRRGRVVAQHAKALSGCVICGSRSGNQIRLFDTGADAAAAVLATSLYQHIPASTGANADYPGSGRKMLAFSDSRQGAAYFAPYLNNSYLRLLQRKLIVDGLNRSFDLDSGPSRIDDVLAQTLQIATRAGYFYSRESRQAKEREVGLWLAQELVAMDTRQSLNGLGMLIWSLDEPERVTSLPVWTELGLTSDAGLQLIEVLLGTVRNQGAVTFPESVDAADTAFAPRLGPIFIREQDSEKKLLSWVPTRGDNKRLNYLTRVLNVSGTNQDPVKVLTKMWEFLSQHSPYLKSSNHPRHGTVYQLDHTWLLAAPPTQNRAIYICDQCSQKWSTSVLGVCPTLRCSGTLQLSDTAVDPENHYRHLYSHLQPIPLKVMEHTAQWDSIRAAEIQNDFVRGNVNALSCSTTFELGVDVGDLQAVLLRNVPPATANYVQRAGRAGRRTDSAALVVTFAQRKSHDLTLFLEPTRMIDGKINPPHIPLGNERIDRRHAHSIAFSAFFRDQYLKSDSTWNNAGEFFAGEGIGEPIGLIRKYLKGNPKGVNASLRNVLPLEVQRELNIDSGEWIDVLIESLTKVRQEIQQEINYFEQERVKAFEENKDHLVNQFGRIVNTIKKRSLLGFLGSRNILPKYGFPVDVVDLRTSGSKVAVGSELDLSRDLSIAIFEYAPEAEIVAGGFLWKSAGIYRLPERDLVQGQFSQCQSCNFFEESVEDLAGLCPQCGKERRSQKYMIPEFGFIAENSPEKPGMKPPTRSWNGGTFFVSPGLVIYATTKESQFADKITMQVSKGATLMAVSTSKTGQGFMLCDWCGRGLSTAAKIPKKHPHTWKSQDCNGPLTRASLAHKYETDVLTIELNATLTLNAQQAWSGLYAILDSTAQVLGISRDDIDGTLSFNHDAPRLILFDTVPGGAGCVLQVPDRIKEILTTAQSNVNNCECGEETSCYSCLRNYRNSIRHDQLSRRDALRLLDSMTSPI